MKEEQINQLSRRERQIMQALFAMGSASAQEVQQAIQSPPGYSAVRAMLSKLEAKGIIYHKEQGAKYIYYPATEKQEASKSALKRVMNTFFNSSPIAAATAMLDLEQDALSADDISALEKMIETVKNRSGD